MRYTTSSASLATVGSHTQVGIDAAQTLTSPAGANAILLTVSAAARIRLDGTNPTASVGMRVVPNIAPLQLPLPTGATLRIIGEAIGAFVDYQFIDTRTTVTD